MFDGEKFIFEVNTSDNKKVIFEGKLIGLKSMKTQIILQ